VFGGGGLSGAIHLDGPAPPIPTTANLQGQPSTSAGPVTFPASVSLTPGQTVAHFSLTTAQVTAAAEVEITASSGGSSARDVVAVHPRPVMASGDLQPTSVEGGDPVTATIRLQSPIPPGLTWTPPLHADNDLRPPQTASFTAGTSEWTGTIPTRPVSYTDRRCLRVEIAGLRPEVGCVQLRPPAATDFDISPVSVFGGRPIAGTLTVSRALSSSSLGVNVGLRILNPAGAGSPLPSILTVTIPAGASSTNWQFSTAVVTEPVTLELSVASGLADTVTVYPLPALAAGALEPSTVEGGDPVTATIRLEAPVPPGLSWTPALHADNDLRPPPTASFAAGASEWTGTIQTRPVPYADRRCLRIEIGGLRPEVGCVGLRPPSVTAFSISPVSVFGGRSISGTLTVSRALASSGLGTNVRLRILSPGGVSPLPSPLTVTVPAGATSTTWQFPTADVTEPVTLELSVPSGLADTVTVYPLPVLMAGALEPTAVEGGDPVTATIRLESPIPPGLTWSPALSGDSDLRPPPAALFAAGSSEWTGTIGTRPVRYADRQCLSVEIGLLRPSVGCVTLQPPAVTGFAAGEAAVFGGRRISGSITFSRTLSNSSFGTSLRLRVLSPAGAVSPLPSPLNVTVAAGQTTATWSFPTSAVSAPVTLELSVPSGLADTVTVHPFPVLQSVALAPDPTTGGNRVQARVRLAQPLPASLAWDVTLIGSGGLLPGGTRTARIPGGTIEWVDSLSTAPVTQQVTAQLIVQSANSALPATVTLVPVPAAPALADLRVVPGSRIFGGAQLALDIALDSDAPAGGTAVGLQSSTPAVVSLPAGATVAGGSRSLTVPVRSQSVATVTAVTLEAILDGTQLRQVVSIEPPPIDRIQIQNTVQAGTRTQATLRLSQPAPAGGLVVPLASSDPSVATVPASVTIPAGATQASFTVQTGTVSQNAEVTLTAGVGLASATFRVPAR